MSDEFSLSLDITLYRDTKTLTMRRNLSSQLYVVATTICLYGAAFAEVCISAKIASGIAFVTFVCLRNSPSRQNDFSYFLS